MLATLANAVKSLRPSTGARRSTQPRRPLLEPMEDRLLLANFIMMSGTSVNEGSGGGTTAMNFTVRLSAPASGDVRVDYSTSDASAVAGRDYVATQGTLVIPDGQMEANVAVPVIADDVVEENAMLQLKLSDPVNGYIVHKAATGTIIDDDTPVDAVVNAVGSTATRGNDGWTELTFTVALNTPVSSAVTVRATTQNLTALDGLDYWGISEVLTFNPGERVKQVKVTVLGSTNTSTKHLVLRLSDSNVTIGQDAFGIIRHG